MVREHGITCTVSIGGGIDCQEMGKTYSNDKRNFIKSW